MGSFKLWGQTDRQIAARTAEATHTTEGGTYKIAELAYVENLDDQPFVKSIGVSIRWDEMTEDQRKAFEGQAAARRLTKAQQDAVDLKVEEEQFQADLQASEEAGVPFQEYRDKKEAKEAVTA